MKKYPDHTSEIITMQNVNKSYKMGSGSLHVLKDISLTVEQGEYLAILGPSGSGKSTLMNIIGCMDVLDEGTYNLDGVPKEKRTARFVCAIAAVLPDGKELVTRQTMEGYIGWEIAGTNGFGYDPIFYLDEYGCSSAELTPQQKNAISHRGKALRAMKEMLVKVI